MKFLFFLALLCCVSVTSFAGDKADQKKTNEVVLVKEQSVAKEDIASEENEAVFACCNSYVTDAATGESFVAVTVCQGGSGAEDYIVSCLRADAIRDRLLQMLDN